MSGKNKVRQELIEAIERIERGEYQNHELLARKEEGRIVKVNVTNVAKEANITRDTIYKYYPDLLEKVGVASTEAKKKGNNKSKLRLKLDDLRAEINELRMEKRSLATHNLKLHEISKRNQEKRDFAVLKCIGFRKKIHELEREKRKLILQ